MDRSSRRFRPPNLSIGTDSRPPISNTIIELDSPVVLLPDRELSSPESASSASSITSPLDPHNLDSESDPTSDDLSKGLAVLERIRKSVQKNLRLRPIRSNGALPKVDPTTSPFPTHSPSWRSIDSVHTPSSETSPTLYFTPLEENRSPLSGSLSARYIGPASRFDPPPVHSPRPPRALDPGSLFRSLSSPKRPLLIDTRPPHAHLTSHIQHSINIAVPSLILKRCKKPAGAFQSLETLRQFITTEQGKSAWDELMGPGGPWDNSVVIYDDDMDPNDQSNPQPAAWALIPVIAPLLSYGNVDYLKGGISAARQNLHLRTLILSGGDFNFGDEEFEDLSQGKKCGGLFQLDTAAATRSKHLPNIEQSTHSTQLPTIPSTNANFLDSSPSPPPSQLAFHRRPPPRRPSAPSLRRLDTKSADHLNPHLPKLQVRTKSATLSVPPTHLPGQPHSPTHLNLAYSNHSPPNSAKRLPSGAINGSSDLQTGPFTSYYTPLHSPSTPMPLPPSPATARPDIDHPPSSEEHAEVFTISAILPNFLFLGPELTTAEHIEQLQELGVKRILNMAAECEDDKGLCLKEVFERYIRIPWRDTVEEEDIARGVREVCEILDDARLHSAPTYVHCRAGKSRSVTAVMAYLIHANHWTLSQAYTFVLERRKGISPNIGFVSELMTFEEEELGGKSNGVQPSASGDQDSEHHDGQGHAAYLGVGNRRPGHIRESLPPVFVTPNSEGNHGGPMSAAPISNARVGDSGQEMEIKDSFGRYRHARRAPVDEQTLQPLRRVSKAGLESSAYA